MTAQVRERLRFRGKDYGMAACPLEGAFHTLRPRPNFTLIHTGCWRGYVGYWAIRRNRLYLARVEARVSDATPAGPSREREFRLDELFANVKAGGVFADWVTDWLWVPDGRQLQYIHAEFASVYERDLYLGVHCGRLVGVRTVDNQTHHESLALTPLLEAVYPAEAAFIRSSLANEADDLPKLVYADWLDEHADPRGEFLRSCVELSRDANGSEAAKKERFQKAVAAMTDDFWRVLMNCPDQSGGGNEWRPDGGLS